MGRRLLLILGILLAASSGGSTALAQEQDQGQDRPPAAPTPVPFSPPSGDTNAETAIPEDLKLPPAPVEAGEKIDEPASRPAAKDDNTGDSHPRTVKSTPANPRGKSAKEKDKEKGKGPATEEESEPPRQLDAGIDDLIRGAKPKGKDPLRIRTDPSVVRTQGPAAPDGAPACAGSHGSHRPDRGPASHRQAIGRRDGRRPGSRQHEFEPGRESQAVHPQHRDLGCAQRRRRGRASRRTQICRQRPRNGPIARIASELPHSHARGRL